MSDGLKFLLGALLVLALFVWVLYPAFIDCYESSPASTHLGRSMDCT